MNKKKRKVNLLNIYLILSSVGILYMTLSNFGIIDLSRETSQLYEMNLTGMPECDRDSLAQTTLCLNWYIDRIFEYRPSNNSEHLTLMELAEFGGDCVDYSSFYLTALEYYGYKAEPVFTDSHVFILASDENIYCILDQVTVNCVGLGEEKQ